MSSFSQKCRSPQPPDSSTPFDSPPVPDFTALAALLQTTAEALLVAANPGLRGACLRDAARAHDQIEESGSSEPDSGEIRCLHLSPLALRLEQELLEEQEVDDFRGLLFNAYASLTGFTSLMENVEAEAEFEGVVIHILAREIKRTERLLLKIQDAYSTVEQVEA